MRYAVAVGLMLLSAGCINLDAPVDVTRYFVMNGPETASEQVGHAVEVRPVEVEPYLATPRMVVRLNDNELQFSDIHRWSEPLADNIQSVLQGYLSVSPIGTISNREGSETRLTVWVQVHRFEGQLPDQAVLDATWSIMDATGKILVKRRSAYSVSGWNGVNYQQLATLLQSAVKQLADEIASAV